MSDDAQIDGTIGVIEIDGLKACNKQSVITLFGTFTPTTVNFDLAVAAFNAACIVHCIALPIVATAPPIVVTALIGIPAAYSGIAKVERQLPKFR